MCSYVLLPRKIKFTWENVVYDGNMMVSSEIEVEACSSVVGSGVILQARR
jgi:hypothetical protein